jgi:hypothetical protein
MSDNFAAGMAYLFGFIAVIIFVVIVIEPPLLHWILRKTTNRNLQLAILALALLPGYLMMMNMGGASIVFWSLLFIAPVAALIPPFAFPDLIGPCCRFRRIISGYIAVILFSILLVLGFLLSGLYASPAIQRLAPMFTAAIYVGLVIMVTLFAFAVYRIMQVLYPAHYVQDEKPA